MYTIRNGSLVTRDANDGANGGAGGAPAGGAAGGGTPPPAPAATPPAPATAVVTAWTAEQQAEISRIATREKAEGQRKAASELAESLGMSIDEAKTLIAAKLADDDSKKTEADRLRDQAANDRAAAAKMLADANLTGMAAHVTAALISAGVVDADPAVQARKHTDLGLLVRIPPNTPADAIPQAIADSVADLKATYPAMFGPAPAGTPPPPSHGAAGGSRPPAGGHTGGTAMDRGAARARQEFGDGSGRPPSTNPFDNLPRPPR